MPQLLFFCRIAELQLTCRFAPWHVCSSIRVYSIHHGEMGWQGNSLWANLTRNQLSDVLWCMLPALTDNAKCKYLNSDSNMLGSSFVVCISYNVISCTAHCRRQELALVLWCLTLVSGDNGYAALCSQSPIADARRRPYCCDVWVS